MKQYGQLWYTIESDKIIIIGCARNATDIVIPEYIEDKRVIIGFQAFVSCTSLKNITIPNSVTSIGMNVFWGCSSLTRVTIPDTIVSIGESAFYNCRSLTSVTIPNSVTYIGDCAFSDCNSLTSITIPDSITSVGTNAFYNCSSLKKIEGRFNKLPPKVDFLNMLDELNKKYCHID